MLNILPAVNSGLHRDIEAFIAWREAVRRTVDTKKHFEERNSEKG